MPPGVKISNIGACEQNQLFSAAGNTGLLFERPDGVSYLKTLPPVRLYSSFAHGSSALKLAALTRAVVGDANLQNFLLDSRGNVWVIDFLFTEPRNHVLRDICKSALALIDFSR